MSLETDIIISIPLAAVTIFVTLTISLRYFNKALKAATKENVIEKTLQELGFKNFKPEQLNASKLDDMGFARFITLIRELRQNPATGGATGGLGNLMQMLQLQAQANAAKAQAAQVATPRAVNPS